MGRDSDGDSLHIDALELANELLKFDLVDKVDMVMSLREEVRNLNNVITDLVEKLKDAEGYIFDIS